MLHSATQLSTRQSVLHDVLFDDQMSSQRFLFLQKKKKLSLSSSIDSMTEQTIAVRKTRHYLIFFNSKIKNFSLFSIDSVAFLLSTKAGGVGVSN
jgi:hypothetical protein